MMTADFSRRLARLVNYTVGIDPRQVIADQEALTREVGAGASSFEELSQGLQEHFKQYPSYYDLLVKMLPMFPESELDQA
ncbi:hypothetical protein [Leucobacter triazinivorans]|uniref:Uncharacterized protein n=1 Tax=Leucobacter triazinivorans TaxID=1784719 RepID=A0A4P6KGT8_9MICO|nr:hypothetical protein [Leucobacter triazinivorans]QBE49636.1 hypothetical protein EVS81_13045 [Leucobacter triazinivorans]